MVLEVASCHTPVCCAVVHALLIRFTPTLAVPMGSGLASSLSFSAQASEIGRGGGGRGVVGEGCANAQIVDKRGRPTADTNPHA